MYEFNVAIPKGILEAPTGITYSNGLLPCPLLTPFRVSAKGLGLTLEDGTGRDWMLTLMFVQFGATVAGAGYPVGMSDNATYGNGTVTATYAAALIYAPVGISCHAVTAAGDYGIIQVGGLNGWSVTTAAAAVALGDVLYWTATNELTVAATDANRAKRVAIAHQADANGGALPVGTVMINPIGLGL